MDNEQLKPDDDKPVETSNTGDGIADLASDLIENQSEIQEHAVNAETEKQNKFAEAVADLTDRFGNVFDPKTHVTHADGSPALTKGGKLKCRPGRAPGKKTGSASIVGAPGNNKQGKQDSSQNDENNGDPRQAAIHTVNMLEFIGVTIAGDEWKYFKSDEHGIDERSSGYDAFEQYYKAKGIGDFPPGIALAIWAIGYAAPRFTLPKTKSKISKFTDWFKMKVLARRMKKQPEDKE